MPEEAAKFYDRFAGLYDLQYGAQPDADFWLRLAKRFGGPALELACGTGRVAIPLARAGIRVVGLDSSSRMLEIFRGKLQKERPEVRERIRLKQGDMRDFDFRERFAFAFIPFNSFLHLETVEDEERCLRAIHRNLKEGGVLVVDIFKPDFRGRPAHTLLVDLAREDPVTGTKIVRLSERAYEHDKQLIHTKYHLHVVPKAGRGSRHEGGFTLRYIRDAREMEGLLARCGFRLEKIYGDYKFGPFTPLSKKMIFVARKMRS